MRHPSKRTAQIAHHERLRQEAVATSNIAAFTRAVREIKALTEAPDEYTCIACGADFPDGPHVDLLVAAIVVYGEDGMAVESEDYGILATEKREAGRRFKICGRCVKRWKHHPLAYASLR